MAQNRRVIIKHFGPIALLGFALVIGLLLIPNLGLTQIEPSVEIEKIVDDKFEDQGKEKSVLSLDNNQEKKVYSSPVYHLDNPTNSIGIKWQDKNISAQSIIDIRVYF